MEPERARLLGELLREMKETCGDYFPEEAWYDIHRAFVIPYVEVVIPVLREGEWRVFLLRREAADPHWPGRPWHIPGGIWRLSQSREEACDSIARREMNIEVERVREVMSYKWPDHAYANPISHVCICEPKTMPEESDDARFHPVAHLPENLLLHHGEFLEACVRAFGK